MTEIGRCHLDLLGQLFERDPLGVVGTVMRARDLVCGSEGGASLEIARCWA
ncbi:MAG: hypothetical protein ACYCWN_09235 [Ferrimicrobium sp.]|uniref:hypothetical protein n=1 Tax=Ferrimicrobium acidiphilum TaxID=121039 RepID=UPI0034DCDFED